MQAHKKRSLYLALIGAAVIAPVMVGSVAHADESQERTRRTRAAPPAQVTPPPLASLPIAPGGPAAPQRCFETVLVPAPVVAQTPAASAEAAGAPSDGRQRRGSAPRPAAAPVAQPGPTFLSVPVPCPGDEIGGGGEGAGLLLGGDAPGEGGAGPADQGPAQDGGESGAPGDGDSADAGLGGGDPLGGLPPLSDLGGGIGGGIGGDGPAGLPFQDSPGEGAGVGSGGAPSLDAVPDPRQPNAIPEPSVVALMGMGALAIGLARRRFRKR